MSARPRGRLLQKLLALVAVVFGLVTVVAGMRVLGGADPGYVVFRPLLIFSTAMGVVYAATGIIMLLSLEKGMYAGAAVFILNLLVLGAIGYLNLRGGAVAIDSFGAMTSRTGVWLALFLGLAWLKRGWPFCKVRSKLRTATKPARVGIRTRSGTRAGHSSVVGNATDPFDSRSLDPR